MINYPYFSLVTLKPDFLKSGFAQIVSERCKNCLIAAAFFFTIVYLTLLIVLVFPVDQRMPVYARILLIFVPIMPVTMLYIKIFPPSKDFIVGVGVSGIGYQASGYDSHFIVIGWNYIENLDFYDDGTKQMVIYTKLGLSEVLLPQPSNGDVDLKDEKFMIIFNLEKNANKFNLKAIGHFLNKK